MRQIVSSLREKGPTNWISAYGYLKTKPRKAQPMDEPSTETMIPVVIHAKHTDAEGNVIDEFDFEALVPEGLVNGIHN